jgi:hypothetical protein
LKQFRTISLVVSLSALTGCAMVGAPVSNGALITNLRGPGHVTTLTESPKLGTGCATNLLGLIAMGDASIDTAKRSARITEVASVDYDSFSVLGVYARFCVLVRGK